MNGSALGLYSVHTAERMVVTVISATCAEGAAACGGSVADTPYGNGIWIGRSGRRRWNNGRWKRRNVLLNVCGICLAVHKTRFKPTREVFTCGYLI